MTGRLTVGGAVIALPRGRAIHTILPQPEEVAASLAAAGACRVEVRLRPARADEADLPGDLEAALCAAGVTGASNALTAGRRRGLLYRIATARTSATRARRVAEVAAGLGGAA